MLGSERPRVPNQTRFSRFVDAAAKLSTSFSMSVHGFPGFRDPVVHSLGLEHTDDPKPFGVQPQTKPDQVLRPGMVVNVDMPHTEIGWGSIHLEDTVRVTADGCESLTSWPTDLRVVPAR